MAERSKFQFRMRDLLWAVNLTGVALALTASFLRKVLTGDRLALLAAVVFGAVGVLVGVGAGIGCLLSVRFAKIDRESRNHGDVGSLD